MKERTSLSAVQLSRRPRTLFGVQSGDEKLESGFLRLFLWHICAKAMRWVLL